METNFNIKRVNVEGREGFVIAFIHPSGIVVSLEKDKLLNLPSGGFSIENNPFNILLPKDIKSEEIFDKVSREELFSFRQNILEYAREHVNELIDTLETGFSPELRELQKKNYNLPELLEIVKEYPLYSQDGKGGDALVIAKFFFPASAATWYVTEGTPNKEGTDIEFFGYVENLVPGGDELGYFTLSELSEVTRFGLFIERDSYFTKTRLGDLVPKFNGEEWKPENLKD